MNNKAQSPLMIALESGNYILVDYLINQANVEINADISHDGKTLLHYFAIQCDEYDLIQTLIKLPINNEIKKMGQMFDNNGRTPFHYCASKFDGFCQKNQSIQVTDQLKKQYQSIIQMIEYCLQSVQCDPDAEIRSIEELKTPEINQTSDDESGSSDEESDQPMDVVIQDDENVSKPKETSIFSLLRTVSFADNSLKHPLEIFLTKSKNLNVLHHETHRTPLLQAIHLQEYKTAHMLINQSTCDINLSNECQQTPLILACKLQILAIIKDLLNHKQCDILAHDYKNNQAIHYYLSTSIRSTQYLEILNLFIEKIKSISHLNLPGKSERTPLHLAVYHNLGTVDSTTDVEQTLIDHGSDLFIKDKLGNLPLHNLFISKNVSDDPVELCVLIIKAMKFKSLDTENNDGNTPLHLAVAKCSTVCVTFLQQHGTSLFIENKLSNSIIGTCIASGHLNLFITFLQQKIDIDLGKLHTSSTKDLAEKSTKKQKRKTLKYLSDATEKIEEKDIWKWKYIDPKPAKDYEQHSLIYLIISRDWQGALSLILNDIEHFHLTYIEIIEAAILNNKLNLVLRLLLRIKDKTIYHNKNSQRQNLFHLLANMNFNDENLFQQILLHLHEHHLDWNLPDKYGSYPIHYACVKQNFYFINFLHEKYSIEFNINQTDAFENTAIGLLFWKIPSKELTVKEQIRLLITSTKELNCLCNYDNDIAMNPLSFGYVDSIIEKISYPPIKSDSAPTNVRTSPLINAIVYNNFELAKFLLELGADVNFPDEEKRTPLMHAVRQVIENISFLINLSFVIHRTIWIWSNYF